MLMLPVVFALMTYNVHYANPDPAASLDAIATADAEIVLLQEITDAWVQRLEQRFAKQYPHRVFHPARAGGLAVLSKRKIKSDTLFAPPSGGYFPAERVVIASSLGDVQILHVHLRPNVDRGNWVLGWKTTPPIRIREIKAYWPELDATVPTIVAGDFNELPDGGAVKFLVDKGMSRVVTSGPRTWHHVVEVAGKKLEGLAADIDHVVIDGTFSAKTAEVLDAGASDHRPVVVTLARSAR